MQNALSKAYDQKNNSLIEHQSVAFKKSKFDRNEHIYRNDQFVELVKDAVRFFNGTPVHSLPPPERFWGTGVYALYYTGKNPLYDAYCEINRQEYSKAIYVGKAVPKGWRQARVSGDKENKSTELFNRLREHSRSISATKDLEISDFSCRFVIFEDAGSDMISTIEAALIKSNQPAWNVSLDGFGNHDPGSGRYLQKKSDWDVLHSGRKWAQKCRGTPNERITILRDLKETIQRIRKAK